MSKATTLQVPKLGYSVAEFCKAMGISKKLYYELVKAGKGPRSMRLGRRRVISERAMTDWQRERESEAVK